MKSCLKLTPPLTPQLSSTSGSPIASGDVSPASECVSLPPCRKNVSFCPELEEFFEADDWDRTPAPVAPKLSYQDILELKEIMKSLPRAPQCTFRQYFSTSTSVPQLSLPSPPASSSTPSAQFPISRFATAPSLTPSRWKNRSMSNVDPEILPYLEAVPIQLLPLLPPSNESTHPSTPVETACQPAKAVSQTTPPSISIPILTPPPSLQSSNSSSPALSPASSSPPTPRRKANFSFVPLLPVKEEAKPAPPPPVVAPPTPARKFNMTFVPLLPPEPQPVTTVTSASSTESVELTPQNEVPPETDEDDVTRHSDVDAEVSDVENIHSPPPTYIPLHLHGGSRSYSSTPSLSSASDTDTESETPSVSSPCPSSPADDDTLSNYFVSRASTLPSHSEAFDAELFQRSLDIGANGSLSNHNPYFPSLPADSTIHRLTPSAITLGPRAAVSSPNDTLPAAITQMKLEALPSPALLPPSPFSLYPSESANEGQHEVDWPVPDAGALDSVQPLTRVSGLTKALPAKRTFIARPSTLSALQEIEASPALSPELTIESMRNAMPILRARQQAMAEERNVLQPSFSRRDW